MMAPRELVICEARIRPFPNDREMRCYHWSPHPGETHEAVLEDYAYPGSRTVITWEDSDRRNYYGEWPGLCAHTPGCILPDGHPRHCVKP